MQSSSHIYILTHFVQIIQIEVKRNVFRFFNRVLEGICKPFKMPKVLKVIVNHKKVAQQPQQGSLPE